jgi:hypothetical protein
LAPAVWGLILALTSILFYEIWFGSAKEIEQAGGAVYQHHMLVRTS